MDASNFFIVFEGKNPGIYSSWEDARNNENIVGQHFRTVATMNEAFAVFSIYKEPVEIRLLRAAMYGAPTEGKRTKDDGSMMEQTEQDIEDAMVIGKWVVANPVCDESNEDEVDDTVKHRNRSSNGGSSDNPKAGH